jgi:Fe-S cluster biogenesis protein NfuA
MRERVEQVLTQIRPRLGGADVQLIDINEGVVTLQYFKQLAVCQVKTRGPMTEEIVLEIVEEELKKEVPEVKGVIMTR